MCTLLYLLSSPRLKIRKAFGFPLRRNLSGESGMRILNVAEKNDAAKNISALLSNGTAIKREGLSKYCKIYEFEYDIFGRNNKMIMTSVAGHIINIDFPIQYRNWERTDPAVLFEAPTQEVVLSDSIKETLEREIRSCSKLIIWTDCDREGENIGFEIINVCKAVNRNIQVHRAVFSEITSQSVNKALRNLKEPNKDVSNAVAVRRELDLRIGAAFTRFQTAYLRRSFPDVLNKNIISYGSCQFPTLGFVVERFKAISEFKPEKFWQISVEHTVNNLTVSFEWSRYRLFDKLACEVLYDKCATDGTAKVEKIETKPKKKWRPKPLETTELQKLATSKLRINAKTALSIAEKLYSQGLISYPRTETNFFTNDINLVSLVQHQVQDPHWGGFAQKVLTDGPNPFQGNKSDQAHPPIHPIKYTNSLTGNDGKIYELIVRHFLACLSKHAEGLETTVDISLGGEKFSAKGLMITAKNYLEVYPYERWSDKEIHLYSEGDVFKPEIAMEESETSPPELLTEADLISLMQKHGIGTDATHAEHIETIKARLYVGLQNAKYFVPRTLGMGLVEGYNNMGYDGLSKPEMRAALENDLKKICDRQKTPEEVLEFHISAYKNLYQGVQNNARQLAEAIQNYIQCEAVSTDPVVVGENASETVGKCPKCYSDLVLKTKRTGGKFIGCASYPDCTTVLWLPSFVLDVTATKDICPKCGPNTYLLRFKFKKGSCYFPPDHIGCIGGCDSTLLQLLTINNTERPTPVETRRPVAIENNDSGFISLSETPPAETVNIGSTTPNCHCGIPAVCLTVKKSGPNKGKEFYKCSSLAGAPGCDFFAWKEEKTVPMNFRRNEATNVAELRCYCSLPCRRSTTKKEGRNKGRDFFSCGKDLLDSGRCNFFKWADSDVSIKTAHGGLNGKKPKLELKRRQESRRLTHNSEYHLTPSDCTL